MCRYFPRAVALIFSVLVTLGTAVTGNEGAVAPGIVLSAPMERHVFQRRGESGLIWVQGTVSGGADEVDVQVTLSNQVIVPWHPIAFDTDQFESSELVPQGGWYSVQVRASRGGSVGWVSVGRVGIGEVFLTAGQSNSANSGAFRFTAKDTVSAWTGTGWVVANDPQPIADGNRGSTWAVMGNHLTEKLGRAGQGPLPIGLISVGVGDTAVGDWVPGAEPLVPRFNYPLFDRISEQVRTFGPWGGFRAVLWDQGEADSHRKTPAEVYSDDLTTIIRTMRSLRGPSDPDSWWIIAHATSIYDHPHQIDQVMDGQTQAIHRNPPAFPGPDTNELVPPSLRQKDDTHFTKKAQEIVGHAWAEIVLGLLRHSGDRTAVHADALEQDAQVGGVASPGRVGITRRAGPRRDHSRQSRRHHSSKDVDRSHRPSESDPADAGGSSKHKHSSKNGDAQKGRPDSGSGHHKKS